MKKLKQLRPWYTRLTYNQIFQLFCVTGAILQIVYVCQQYLKFDSNTRALIYIPDQTKLPDTIFCFDLIYMINHTKLIAFYPDLFGSSIVTKASVQNFRKRFLYNGYLNNLTIRQTWDLMLPGEVAIESATVWSAESKDKKNQVDCPFRTIFYRHAYCFVFTCSLNKMAIAWSQSLYRGSQTLPMFEVAFRQSFIETIRYYYLALVQPSTIPLGSSVKWESQETGNVTTSHRYFFYSLQVNYLPKPYPTDCRNYTKLGYKSRDDMLNKCQTLAAIKRTGAPLVWSIIDYPYDTPSGNEVNAKRKNDPEYGKIIGEIVTGCTNLARQPDCVSNSYYATIRNPIPISGNLAKLSIDYIKDPIFTITYEPEMTILDAIIMIGSILGTWLGFSIASHLPRVTQLFGTKMNSSNNQQESKLLPLYPYPGYKRLRDFKQSADYNFSTKFPSYNYHHRSSLHSSSNFRFPFYLFYELPKSHIKTSPIRRLSIRNLNNNQI